MNTEQRKALAARAESALESLYHNATPRYPRDFGPFADSFEDWFSDTASWAIQELQEGGAEASPKTYQRNARALYPMPEGVSFDPLQSPRQSAYCRKAARAYRLEGAHYPYTRAADEFGKLYTWGRGGRTLAPDSLIRERGGSSFGIKRDAFEDYSAAALTDAIRVLESFNDYVETWNRGVPEMWADYTKERADIERGEAREEIADSRRDGLSIVRDLKRLRDAGVALSEPACRALVAALRSKRASLHAAFAILSQLAEV